MNKERLICLLDPVSDALTAYSNLVEIGDELVRIRLTSDESFWTVVNDFERKVFSVIAIMHSAGGNGLEALFEHYTGSALAIIRLGMESFLEMGEVKYAELLNNYFGVVEEALTPYGVRIPREFSEDRRREFVRAERDFIHKGVYKLIRLRVQSIDASFIGLFESSLPVSALSWIRVNRAEIETTLCS